MALSAVACCHRCFSEKAQQFCALLAEVRRFHSDSTPSKPEFCYLTAACKWKFIQALHAAFLTASLDLLEGDTGHFGIRLNFFPERPRTLTATVFRLVNQHEAEVVLGILTGANNIDGEVVLSGSGKYIYATTLQRRTRKLRMAAAFFESAGLAETAGTSAHTESFIKSLQKKLFLQSDRNYFRFAATRFE
jgi:hypothetical protein